MRVMPPEQIPFSRQRYLSDLVYRFECDQEVAAERHERIKLLFNSLTTDD